jgi:enolase
MSVICDVHADEVLDSRGNPTLKVYVETEMEVGTFTVPSGASTGKKEALELRDGDKKRYGGKGVLKAVKNVNDEIAQCIKGMEITEQTEIDRAMIDLDGTENKSNLGANAIVGVSLACARTASKELDIPLYFYLGGLSASLLPIPMFNVMNGGKHADNNIDFQEFMIMPVGAESFREALRMSSEVFQVLKGILKEKGMFSGVGDEGGFAPNLSSYEEPLKLMSEAVEKAGYKLDKDIVFALDPAASSFYSDNHYTIGKEKLTSSEMIDVYKEIVNNYPVVSIEDGLAEDDWDGWAKLTEDLGDEIQLVGDDIFVTNIKLLEKGIDEEVANAILIKPNQIGTLTETLFTIRLAMDEGYGVVISHRSGETDDTFIADLAVAMNTGMIKTGSVCRGERIVKYNRLMDIERGLGKRGQCPTW